MKLTGCAAHADQNGTADKQRGKMETSVVATTLYIQAVLVMSAHGTAMKL